MGLSLETDLVHSNSKWEVPPPEFALTDDRIHIWKIPLNFPVENLNTWVENLLPDEIKRAELYHFAADRNRFLISRAALRSILGSYMCVEPKRVRFKYEAKGKPILDAPFNRKGVEFNLSHSHEIGLIGFSLNASIGVDVEFIRREPAIKSIARRFFTRTEAHQIFDYSPDNQEEAFFRCWTLKEAYIKARGDGFITQPYSFEIAFLPEEKSRLISILGDKKKASEFSLFHVSPGPGYIGGVAVHKPIEQIDLWTWDPQNLLNN